MTNKYKNLSGKHLLKILIKMGFKKIRQKGSHVILRHGDGRTTVVPLHGKETIGIGLMTKIIKNDLKMTFDEFENNIS